MNFLLKLVLVITVAVYQAECNNKTNHLISKRAIASSVCAGNICMHGVCEIISQIQYACHCSVGFTGTNCDRVAPANQPCQQNPCYGEATCYASFTAFQCICPAGYGGALCEGTTGTCSCQNGGQCKATSGPTGILAYACTCPTNFGGNLCQFSKTTFQSCQNTGCFNGGYCSIFSTCYCPAGFSGPTCQTSSLVLTTVAPGVITTIAPVVTVTPYPLNICAPGICLNGGACYQITNALALCLCPAGYSGVYCNIVPDTIVTLAPVTVAPVTVAPVTVTPVTNAPVTITPVTVGPVTVAPVLSCSNSINPCKNGGICLVDGSSFRCSCAPAYTGYQCETGYTCTNVFCPTGQKCQISTSFLPECVNVVRF